MKEPPYSFTWTNVNSGAYHLTVLAIDKSNAVASSNPVDIYVNSHKDADNEVVNLYPNPNSGNFTIALTTPFKNESNRISISNSSGVKVFEGNLQKEELSKKFDLSHLNSGIYVLMIVGKEILVTKKFIKN